MLLSLTLVFTISDSLSNVSLATNRICFVFMLSFFSSLLHVIATSCHFGCMRQLHFPPSISTNLSLHHDQIYNVLLVQNRLSSYLSHRSKLYHIAQFQYSNIPIYCFYQVTNHIFDIASGKPCLRKFSSIDLRKRHTYKFRNIFY